MEQLFTEVLNQFQSGNQYEKLIKESQKEYDIKIYRLHSFSLEYANKVYNQLQQMYHKNEIKELPQGWYEHERRLYVWFIVCFLHMKGLEPIKFVSAEKYWKHISQIFWGKHISFLKYQLLTIIKPKGRTTWKPQEDELLKEAQRKQQKGQWNEVAKYCYFQSRGEFFKTPKQCRQRWQNHLNNEIKRGQWTNEEDRILFEFVKINGPKWARIIPLLNNSRTQHMIKNRYKAIVNKVMIERNVTQTQAVNLTAEKLNEDQLKGCEQSKSLMDQRRVFHKESQNLINQINQAKALQKYQQKRKVGRKQKIKFEEDNKMQIPLYGTEGTRSNSGNLSINANEKSNVNTSGFIADPLRNSLILSSCSDSFFKANYSDHFNHNILLNSGRFSVSNGFNHPNGEERNVLTMEKRPSFRGERSEKFEPILLESQLYKTKTRGLLNQSELYMSGLIK